MRARPRIRQFLLLLALVGLVGTAAACGDDDDTSTAAGGTGDPSSSEAPAPADPAACAEAAGTVQDGVLTIATDSPAFDPWFSNNDPTNGKGFESAVAYAVAEQLGFGEDQVEWTVVPFNNVFAPGPKDFDFDINQVSINNSDRAVDFSDGYYDVNQAIVGFEDSPAADATTVEELQGLKLGAQIGTTSLDFINEVIQPEQEAFVYNDNAAAKATLEAEQVDGIVLDYPTAWYVSAVEIEGTTVIAQFTATGEPEQFGLVFEEGNPLRDCANAALAALEEDGTLADLQAAWLSDAAGAPVIEVE